MPRLDRHLVTLIALVSHFAWAATPSVLDCAEQITKPLTTPTENSDNSQTNNGQSEGGNSSHAQSPTPSSTPDPSSGGNGSSSGQSSDGQSREGSQDCNEESLKKGIEGASSEEVDKLISDLEAAEAVASNEENKQKISELLKSAKERRRTLSEAARPKPTTTPKAEKPKTPAGDKPSTGGAQAESRSGASGKSPLMEDQAFQQALKSQGVLPANHSGTLNGSQADRIEQFLNEGETGLSGDLAAQLREGRREPISLDGNYSILPPDENGRIEVLDQSEMNERGTQYREAYDKAGLSIDGETIRAVDGKSEVDLSQLSEEELRITGLRGLKDSKIGVPIGDGKVLAPTGGGKFEVMSQSDYEARQAKAKSELERMGIVFDDKGVVSFKGERAQVDAIEQLGKKDSDARRYLENMEVGLADTVRVQAISMETANLIAHGPGTTKNSELVPPTAPKPGADGKIDPKVQAIYDQQKKLYDLAKKRERILADIAMNEARSGGRGGGATYRARIPGLQEQARQVTQELMTGAMELAQQGVDPNSVPDFIRPYFDRVAQLERIQGEYQPGTQNALKVQESQALLADHLNRSMYLNAYGRLTRLEEPPKWGDTSVTPISAFQAASSRANAEYNEAFYALNGPKDLNDTKTYSTMDFLTRYRQQEHQFQTSFTHLREATEDLYNGRALGTWLFDPITGDYTERQNNYNSFLERMRAASMRTQRLADSDPRFQGLADYHREMSQAIQKAGSQLREQTYDDLRRKVIYRGAGGIATVATMGLGSALFGTTTAAATAGGRTAFIAAVKTGAMTGGATGATLYGVDVAARRYIDGDETAKFTAGGLAKATGAGVVLGGLSPVFPRATELVGAYLSYNSAGNAALSAADGKWGSALSEAVGSVAVPLAIKGVQIRGDIKSGRSSLDDYLAGVKKWWGGGDSATPKPATGGGDSATPKPATGGGDSATPKPATGGGDSATPKPATGGGDSATPKPPTDVGDSTPLRADSAGDTPTTPRTTGGDAPPVDTSSSVPRGDTSPPSGDSSPTLSGLRQAKTHGSSETPARDSTPVKRSQGDRTSTEKVATGRSTETSESSGTRGRQTIGTGPDAMPTVPKSFKATPEMVKQVKRVETAIDRYSLRTGSRRPRSAAEIDAAIDTKLQGLKKNLDGTRDGKKREVVKRDIAELEGTRADLARLDASQQRLYREFDQVNKGRDFPYGFSSKREFDSFSQRFTADLRAALEQPGNQNIEILLGGSAVEGLSFRNKDEGVLRRPFGETSDLDMVVVLPKKTFDKVVRSNKDAFNQDYVREGGGSTYPVDAEKLGGYLRANPKTKGPIENLPYLLSQASDATGRKVNLIFVDDKKNLAGLFDDGISGNFVSISDRPTGRVPARRSTTRTDPDAIDINPTVDNTDVTRDPLNQSHSKRFAKGVNDHFGRKDTRTRPPVETRPAGETQPKPPTDTVDPSVDMSTLSASARAIEGEGATARSAVDEAPPVTKKMTENAATETNVPADTDISRLGSEDPVDVRVETRADGDHVTLPNGTTHKVTRKFSDGSVLLEVPLKNVILTQPRMYLEEGKMISIMTGKKWDIKRLWKGGMNVVDYYKDTGFETYQMTPAGDVAIAGDQHHRITAYARRRIRDGGNFADVTIPLRVAAKDGQISTKPYTSDEAFGYQTSLGLGMSEPPTRWDRRSAQGTFRRLESEMRGDIGPFTRRWNRDDVALVYGETPKTGKSLLDRLPADEVARIENEVVRVYEGKNPSDLEPMMNRVFREAMDRERLARTSPEELRRRDALQSFERFVENYARTESGKPNPVTAEEFRRTLSEALTDKGHFDSIGATEAAQQQKILELVSDRFYRPPAKSPGTGGAPARRNMTRTDGDAIDIHPTVDNTDVTRDPLNGSHSKRFAKGVNDHFGRKDTRGKPPAETTPASATETQPKTPTDTVDPTVDMSTFDKLGKGFGELYPGARGFVSKTLAVVLDPFRLQARGKLAESMKGVARDFFGMARGDSQQQQAGIHQVLDTVLTYFGREPQYVEQAAQTYLGQRGHSYWTPARRAELEAKFGKAKGGSDILHQAAERRALSQRVAEADAQARKQQAAELQKIEDELHTVIRGQDKLTPQEQRDLSIVMEQLGIGLDASGRWATSPHRFDGSDDDLVSILTALERADFSNGTKTDSYRQLMRDLFEVKKQSQYLQFDDGRFNATIEQWVNGFPAGMKSSSEVGGVRWYRPNAFGGGHPNMQWRRVARIPIGESSNPVFRDQNREVFWSGTESDSDFGSMRIVENTNKDGDLTSVEVLFNDNGIWRDYFYTPNPDTGRLEMSETFSAHKETDVVVDGETQPAAKKPKEEDENSTRACARCHAGGGMAGGSNPHISPKPTSTQFNPANHFSKEAVQRILSGR